MLALEDTIKKQKQKLGPRISSFKVELEGYSSSTIPSTTVIFYNELCTIKKDRQLTNEIDLIDF